MKNIILVAMLCICQAATVFSQKIKSKDIPKAVSAAFASRFPEAKATEWEKENETEYEAGFKLKNVEHCAKFDVSGKWLETETEIEHKQLPVEISAELAKNFAGYKPKEAEKVETHDMGTVYEVELTKAKETLEVTFDATGKVISQKVGKEGKQD